MGVDEWLMMCKKVKPLLDKFPVDWQSPDPDSDEEARGEQLGNDHSHAHSYCALNRQYCITVKHNVI